MIAQAGRFDGPHPEARRQMLPEKGVQLFVRTLRRDGLHSYGQESRHRCDRKWFR
jgi:hypothetical protein